MNKNRVVIALVLDRSGSMSAVAEETISGVNHFIKTQRELPGEALFTLVQFDSQGPFDIVHNLVPIDTVIPLDDKTYVPRGGTPLYDAIGKTIDHLGLRPHAMPEFERPHKVIFGIMTDGMENASTEYTAQVIADKIKHQTDIYGWEFSFLGANQNAIMEAGKIGIRADAAMTYAADKQGTKRAFHAYAMNVSSSRTSGAYKGFDQQQRDEQKR